MTSVSSSPGRVGGSEWAGGGAGVAAAAADGGDVADAHSGDVAVDLGEEGPALLDDGRGLDVAVVGEGADVQAVRLGADAGEAGGAGGAVGVLRLDEGLLHEDDEGGAAGHRPGVLAVLLEEGEDLRQAGGGGEGESAHLRRSLAGSGDGLAGGGLDGGGDLVVD